MNQQPTEDIEPDAKRADQLAIGDHVIETPAYERDEQPMRVTAVQSYRDDNRRPMVALLLDALDGTEPMYARVKPEKLYDLAEQEWFFTFGFDHTLPDGTRLADRYVRMTGMTGDDARAVMFVHFGNRWSHQYRTAGGAGVERYHLTELPAEQWPAHADDEQPTDAQSREIKARYLKAGMTVIDATDGALIVAGVNRYSADRILVSFEGQPEPTVFGLEVGVIVAADVAQAGE